MIRHLFIHRPRRTTRLAVTRAFQSETLRWASENRALAQECLTIPPSTPSGKLSLRSLESYLKWRQWKLPAQLQQASHGGDDYDEVAKNHATALISHVLSAPMTAASQLFRTFDFRPNQTKAKLNWCVLGARSEASLPTEYWREILVLWAHSHPNSNQTVHCDAAPKLDVTIDFVGPDILRRPLVTFAYQGHSLTLRWLYNGTFHEYLKRSQDPSTVSDDMILCDENTWDAYILFNPGLGHANLRSSWEPTLKLFLSSKSTVGMTGNSARIVFTAHSKQDARQDADLLANYLLPEFPFYQENVFASRIEYDDPFEAGHVVRPNHYVYTLVWH